MSFEEEFSVYMDFKDTLPVPEKLYKITEEMYQEERAYGDPLFDEKLTLVDLFERLEHLPHQVFFVQIAEAGFVHFEQRDGTLSLKGVFNMQQGETKQTQGFAAEYSIENKIADRVHPSQSFDFSDELNRSIAFSVNRTPYSLGVKERRAQHERILISALCHINSIFSSREAVQVAEVEEYEDDEEFMETKVVRVPEAKEYILRTWGRCNTYQKADRQARRAIQAAKREHAVSGHWRFYKSGKKVFIKSHKRGDATLGSLITGILIKGVLNA